MMGFYTMYLDFDKVHSYNGPLSRADWLDRLASFFGRDSLKDLQNVLSFYDKIASAMAYGLIQADLDYDAVTNLRELVRRIEAMEGAAKSAKETYGVGYASGATSS